MLSESIHDIIVPSLYTLESTCAIPISKEAITMLAAIGMQESRMEYRYQILSGGKKGPARGLWQFEKGGGVTGVLRHKSCSQMAYLFADERVGSINPQQVWECLEYDDTLACIFARLLLWTDPDRLIPVSKDKDHARASWEYYLRCWRPGKPHPETWENFWNESVDIVSSLTLT